MSRTDKIEIELMNHKMLRATIDTDKLLVDFGKTENVTKGTKKRFLRYLTSGDVSACMNIAWANMSGDIGAKDSISLVEFVDIYQVKE